MGRSVEEWNNILQRLESNDPTLKVLDFRHHKIGPDEFQALVTALRNNTSLRDLDFEGNQIGPEGAQALATVLQNNTTLTHLSLRGNQIGPKGAEALATVLRNNTTLKGLDLEGNQIGSEGAQALATELHNTTLRDLYLGDNEIGPVGAQALANALQNHTTLTHLSLGENGIESEGAKALATVLRNNTTLESLVLRNNKIGLAGIQALATELKNNTTLTSLNIAGNQIGPEGAQALATELQNNTTLESIYLSNNGIGSVGIQALETALERNIALTTLDIYPERSQNITKLLNRNQILGGIYTKIFSKYSYPMQEASLSQPEEELISNNPGCSLEILKKISVDEGFSESFRDYLNKKLGEFSGGLRILVLAQMAPPETSLPGASSPVNLQSLFGVHGVSNKGGDALMENFGKDLLKLILGFLNKQEITSSNSSAGAVTEDLEKNNKVSEVSGATTAVSRSTAVQVNSTQQNHQTHP